MGCSGNSVFGNQSQFIKFQGNDIVAIDGVNTVERLLGGDLRFPYKQLLKSRIVLKVGQVNYLLNHLGLGDNATFLAIKATYNSASVNEEDNYITWNYYDDFSNTYPMDQFMLLTGNSTNRIKQLYLTNPSAKYAVILDVMVASIDDTYTFFPDITNQGGTTFTGLSWTDIASFVVGESFTINDTDSNPLIYMQISNINSISRTSYILTIDDDALGTILLVFVDESNAAQAHSLLSYVLANPNVNIGSVPEDTEPPVIYWLDLVGGTASYISLDGATAGVPYNTSDGYTFSTSISLSQFGPTLSKDILIDILIDYVQDARDGIISITSSNLTLSDGISSITASGTYSLTFDLTDLALNDLSLVDMTLGVVV